MSHWGKKKGCYIPPPLIVIIVQYVSGDLDYIYNNQKKFRQNRSETDPIDIKSNDQVKRNIHTPSSNLSSQGYYTD